MININLSNLKNSKITEGGESEIYKYKGKILKAFKPCVNLKEKERKLKKMLQLQLPIGTIGPLDLVYSENNKFIGYLMEEVTGEEFKKLCSKKFLKINKIKIKTISRMLCELLKMIKSLHKNGIIIGDLNECNVLFDENYRVFLVDADSWSIDSDKCTVAMDLFKDPLMKNGEFTENTDWYAFAILTFKCLTMLHPFGGNMEPEIPLLERMKKGMSVIDNKNVIIPKMLCKGWDFFSQELIKDLKEIFSNKSRKCIEESLIDFTKNLVMCKKHDDYYYNKYDVCPKCNLNAKIIDQKEVPIIQINSKPIQEKSVSGIPYSVIFNSDEILTMLNENVYVNKNNKVCFINSSEQYDYNNKIRYYSFDDNIIVSNSKQIGINIHNTSIIKIDKLLYSKIQVINNEIYYINPSSALCKIQIKNNSSAITKIADVAYNNIFEVYNEKHFVIINKYDTKIIINVDGFNHEINLNYQIEEHGIHYDPINNNWLIMLIDSAGIFHTLIFNKNKLLYDNQKLKVNCLLKDLCFNNDTIYIPKNKKIRGFNYKKNKYKDFEVDIMTVNSKLIKQNSAFIIIKEDGIYKVG